MTSPQQLAAAIRGAAVTAGETVPRVRGADWRIGVVTAVAADGTVSVGDVRARRIDAAYPAPQVGDRIMLTQNSAGNWLAVGRTASAARALGLPMPPRYKPDHTDRASTTTFADDPDLTTVLDANSTYVIEFHLFVGGGPGLIKTQWTVPPDAVGLKGVQGPASTVAGDSSPQSSADNITMRSGSHGHGTTIVYGRRNVYTNLAYAHETGTVSTATGGTCAIAWAQSTSSTTPARMGLGSWMRATRIS